MKAGNKSEGHRLIADWMKKKKIRPFAYQEESRQWYLQGYSGLVVAPTGYGKTWSLLLSLLTDAIDHPSSYTGKLKLLWITPLRSLSKDLVRVIQETLDDIGIDWEVGLRTGDVPQATRKKQNLNMPDILVATPESWHLMLSHEGHRLQFSSLKAVVVDEWHELMGSKRGVLTELALVYTRSFVAGLRVWGLSATIGNLEEALNVLVPGDSNAKLVLSREQKKTEIRSLLPERPELLPWAGHLGRNLVNEVAALSRRYKSMLVFTNTRGQSETWYQALLDADPDLAGQIAVHHGSIDSELRTWIEEHVQNENLRIVVCTSSLDLGVDLKPVEAVVQVGSPKGIARFLQRAGRSGHSPGAVSRIWFVPTNSLELIEVSALRDAIRHQVVESVQARQLSFDVLIQFLVTLAAGDGFNPAMLFDTIRSSHAFHQLGEAEWQWMLRFITEGGDTLNNYREYKKVVIEEDGRYRIQEKRIARLHRMNMGVIRGDAMMRVRYLAGGYIGMVEEYFVSRLKPGEQFQLAGRNLQLVRIFENEVRVRAGSGKKTFTPSWLGGRLPLSSDLGTFLRRAFEREPLHAQSDPELHFLAPLLALQQELSHVPGSKELLVEQIDNRYGSHLFVYPFEGRRIHEVMASVLAWRIARIQPYTFSIAMNDYGFELRSATRLELPEEVIAGLFSVEDLHDDIEKSVNATEMAQRAFRDIASISGLLPMQMGKVQKASQLQASSNILFRVLQSYEAQNILVLQAYREVFREQLDEQGLQRAFKRIQDSRLVFRQLKRFTPLSFPIKVDSLRNSLSTEELEVRIKRMKEVNAV